METELGRIAREQWQADLAGGSVAAKQVEITDQKLHRIGYTREHPMYIAAYKRAQVNVNPPMCGKPRRA